MSRLLEPIAGRLGKLIRLLSSDKDGEVLAAVAAIRRTLDAEKLDLHALADGIDGSGKGSQADYAIAWNAGYSAGKEAAEREAPHRDQPSWHDIACECREHADELGAREQQFVHDMCRRTVRGGALTEKQAKWLRDIYVKVGRNG
jgi:hypothetical protein